MKWLITALLVLPISSADGSSTPISSAGDFTLTTLSSSDDTRAETGASGGDFKLSPPTEKAGSGCPCQTGDVPIFEDGFESGSTGAWSETQP